jgi:hypothetical protein
MTIIVGGRQVLWRCFEVNIVKHCGTTRRFWIGTIVIGVFFLFDFLDHGQAMCFEVTFSWR